MPYNVQCMPYCWPAKSSATRATSCSSRDTCTSTDPPRRRREQEVNKMNHHPTLLLVVATTSGAGSRVPSTLILDYYQITQYNREGGRLASRGRGRQCFEQTRDTECCGELYASATLSLLQERAPPPPYRPERANLLVLGVASISNNYPAARYCILVATTRRISRFC